MTDTPWHGQARTLKPSSTFLRKKRFAPPVLVGHSKGNHILSEALYAIAGKNPGLAKKISMRSRIVTISAKIGMPLVFKDIVDVMGEWDWFGALNSRPDITAEYVVPHAWHSTNSSFPMGMGSTSRKPSNE